MKSGKLKVEKQDKLLGNPKLCKRWLVWFRATKEGIAECCGSSAWYPLDGRVSLDYIDKHLTSSNIYKYRPAGAEFYRIWKGSILNGNYITELKVVN